jgi:hypothetical protein
METTSADRRHAQRPRPLTGRSGNQRRPSPNRTPAPVADGFLSCAFVPKYEPAAGMPSKAIAESDFFKSLSCLRSHYTIPLENYRSLPYPYNVLMATKAATQAIAVSGRKRELFIVDHEDSRIALSVQERFPRDFALYYIPVAPLYSLWQKPESLAAAELLTAVCAYLYIEAGISYYRDEDSYMSYNYEMLDQWVEDCREEEPDSEEYAAQRKELDEAITCGDFVQEKMMATGFRQRLPELITAFQSQNDLEREVLRIAQETLRIWQAYPNANLFAHASDTTDEDDDLGYGYDNSIYMHEYIGFVGSLDNGIGDTLIETVENDFNERLHMQEPELLTHFTEPQAAYTDKLAYEQAVLTLIADLCTLL